VRKRLLWVFPGALALCCLGSATLYFLPPIHERLAWRVNNAWVGFYRLLNPPQELVFVPQQGTPSGLVETLVQSTLAAFFPPLTPTALDPAALLASLTSTPMLSTASPIPTPTPSPTATPFPLPPSAVLSGIRHQPQQFNNCGPASLAMDLSFWGWSGDQNDTRLFLRPNREVDDKNVNPAEMVTFVETYTGLRALTRVAGDLELLKRLIAAGFPVMIEEGHDPLDDWWMGHYLVINGYDDRSSQFTTQDSLLGSPDALVPYARLATNWRDFNSVYLVIYPPEREEEVLALLSPSADEAASYHAAVDLAQREISTSSGRAQLFAWFNLGSSLVGLGDYPLAAQAFDQAFKIYASLPEDKTDPDSRPFRLMWYRFGPYEAYYHTGRYQDLIDLANTTFAWVGRPVLEESYYWRALAYEALGNRNQAISDLKKALNINPNFTLARQALEELGGAPG
jgi:hypothetical protein